MGKRINRFLHKASGGMNRFHIFDTDKHRRQREGHQDKILEQRNEYSSKHGLISGWGYRSEQNRLGRANLKTQKIKSKQNLKEKKLNLKQWKKEQALQHRIEHPFKYWGPKILIIVIPIFLFWYFFMFTGYGQDISIFIEEQNVLPEAEKELEESGISHQFRIIGQILTGEFDPEKLWTSEAVQSEYAVPEEFEIFLEDVGPRKSSFSGGEAIEIGGRINLVSGFDKTTTVTLGAEPDKLCTDTVKKKFTDWLTKTDTDDECSTGDWTCYISGSKEQNVFQMERIYNRQFYCTHAGVEVEDEEVISDLKVTWDYATSAVAGKQIYVFSQNAISKDPEPLDYYGVDKDSLTSWYIGDEQVNLGLGLDRDREYILAEEDLYEGKAEFEAVYYLAISIQNTGGGKISSIESLSVSFPNDANIKVAEQIKEKGKGDVFIGPTTEVVTIRKVDVTTKKFSLSDSEIKKFDEIEPAEHTTYYIPFAVDKEYISSAAFRSFLAKAEIRYKYKDYEPVSVTVKP